MSSEAFNADAWTGSFQITSSNLKVDEAVGNVYYDLSNAPSLLWGIVASDGRDIRVTNSDGTITYSFEVSDDFNTTTMKGSLFFDSSILSTSADTTWRIYAGNSAATLPGVTDTLGRNNVWDSNYSMIQRLDSDPSGTAPQFTDSTGNGNDATSVGTMTSGDLVTGQIGNAIDFDGTDDYLTIPDASTMRAQEPITAEGWMNHTNLTQSFMFSKRGGTNDGWGFLMIDTNKLRFVWFGILAHDSNTISDTSGWHHMAMSITSSGALTFYYDGVAVGTASTGATFTTTTFPMLIGAIADSDGTPRLPTTAQILDELRISSTARSANYFTTHYNNQNSPSTFWTTGAWVYAAPPKSMHYSRLRRTG